VHDNARKRFVPETLSQHYSTVQRQLLVPVTAHKIFKIVITDYLLIKSTKTSSVIIKNEQDSKADILQYMEFRFKYNTINKLEEETVKK